MDEKQLKETLEQLHEELSQIESLDDEKRELLETIADDVHAALDREEPPAREEIDSFAGRFNDALLKFEVDHPHLAGLIERLTSGLANLGI